MRVLIFEYLYELSILIECRGRGLSGCCAGIRTSLSNYFPFGKEISLTYSNIRTVVRPPCFRNDKRNVRFEHSEYRHKYTWCVQYVPVRVLVVLRVDT